MIAGRERHLSHSRFDSARDRAQVCARDVQRHVDPTLTVLALDFIWRGHDADIGHVAQPHRRAGGRLDHHVGKRMDIAAHLGFAPQRHVKRLLVTVDFTHLLPGDQRLRLSPHFARGKAERGKIGGPGADLDLRHQHLLLDLEIGNPVDRRHLDADTFGRGTKLDLIGTEDTNDHCRARAAQHFLDALAQIGEHVAVEAGIAVDHFLYAGDAGVIVDLLVEADP